jgi:pentose-5-phosphate-3-epimerase
MTNVAVEPWHRDLGDHVVGGSVYAVDPSLRVQAAVQLAAARCRVHADVILGPDGRHRGVSWDELTAIRRATPTARIDLHLIVLGQSAGPARVSEERRAIEIAVQVGAEFITVSRQGLALHADELAAARAAGTNLWLELRPDQPGTDAAGIAVDGVLVMLIQPGTKQTANLAHLEKVERLAQNLPVAVDGGVTRTIAARSRQLGAGYTISGRDLLTVTPPRPEDLKKGDTSHATS